MSLTNEDLLAISQLLDTKLKAELKPIQDDIETIKNEQKRSNIIIENEIRSDVRMLAENYMPAANKYEKATAKIEAMQADIDVMKSVIREHSEKLQKIS